MCGRDVSRHEPAEGVLVDVSHKEMQVTTHASANARERWVVLAASRDCSPDRENGHCLSSEASPQESTPAMTGP